MTTFDSEHDAAAEHRRHADQQERDDVVAVLRARVAARKESGEYPQDLDERLEELAQMAKDRTGNPSLSTALDQLRRAADFGRHRIHYDSSVPFGSFLHRTLARINRRQTDALLRQMDDYAGAVDHVLGMLADLLGNRETVDSVSRRVDLLLERLAALERSQTLSHRDRNDTTNGSSSR